MEIMGHEIVDKSVTEGDIDDANLATETVRRKIRDNFIRDATVTVVLIGPCTWQRKHVDWEIGSSLRATTSNPRCGLLGILLPNHPNAHSGKYNSYLLPPRLADNVGSVDPYAILYSWSENAAEIRNWIHRAFVRKGRTPPKNSRPQFGRNRGGLCIYGWRN